MLIKTISETVQLKPEPLIKRTGFQQAECADHILLVISIM